MEVKLPDVCKIQYGFAFDSAQFSTTAGTPLIRIRDVVRGYSETYTDEKCSEEYIVNNGDILIGMDGEFNIARWNGGQALLNQRVCRLLPKANIDKDYLFYFMPQALRQIEDKTPFATVKHLSAKQLNAVVISLPAIEIQQQIASILNKLNNIISLRKQQLAKLDELVKARFVEMFGDPVSNPKKWDTPILSKCLSGIENGKSFVCGAEPRQRNWPAVLKLSAVTYGVFQPNENKAVLDTKDYLQTSEVKIGDLLFTRKNTPELVGMSAYVFDTEPRLMMPDLVFRLNTNECCDKIFLWQLINHDLFRGSISNLATGSAKSMSNISKERLANLRVICPPIKQQQQFAKFVRQTYRQKLTIQQSLDKLEVLKKSLMQEYFG